MKWCSKMSENRKFTPKELIKELIEGSEYSLKESVKGRVRIVGRDNKIINFLPKQFGVESLNDKLSLNDEQIEKIKANFLSILRGRSEDGEQSALQAESSAEKKSVKNKSKFNFVGKNRTLQDMFEESKTQPQSEQKTQIKFVKRVGQNVGLVAVRKKRSKIPCKVRISFLRKS